MGNAAAATKAVATGDPRYVEQVSLEDDVKRLTAMVRAHSDAKARNAAERRSVAREVTAVTVQIVELDRALPALAANSSAPFAMSVRGKTYRERAEAAPALVDSLRHAYGEGKRYGNTKEFPIAEFRGVGVTASRMLSSDEMIVTLSVPGRSRIIQAKDFTGVDTASVGLVRRVENMVADTPNYREELNRRHEHALTRIAELEAVADEPFEHTDALRDKRHRLDTLTAALQTSADSPEAKAKETEHQQRMDAQGREPGWSLALNPTPALRAEFGDVELPAVGDTAAAARIPGGWWVPGWVRDPATRWRDRGHRVCRGRSNWPIWARAIRTPRRSSGRRMCWDDVAPDRSPRTGTATRTAAGKSRSANRLSRSGCGRLRRWVVVLAPGGGVFGAGLAGAGCLRRSESGVVELLCGPPSG